MTFAFTAIAIAIAGIATSVSLSVASISQQRKAAKNQLRAQSAQAGIAAQQKIKSVKKLAAQQRSSFLASGISLTGDGTADTVISETFDFGMEDVENIKRNGAVLGENISANARARMLSTYGNMASDISSYASSALGSAGSLKAVGSDSIDLGGGLEGMGESYGNFGTGSGSSLNFDPNQAPSGFGNYNPTNLGI